MNRLEDELRKTLQRVEPPAGFAERVMARAANQERSREKATWPWLDLFRNRGLQWAATCALCLAIATGGIVYHHEEVRRAQGEEAKQQLMLALRITASKLQVAESEVRQIGSTN